VGKNTSSLKKDSKNMMFLSSGDLGLDSPRLSVAGDKKGTLGQANSDARDITAMTIEDPGKDSIIQFAAPHIRPGNMVLDNPKYEENLKLEEYPETALDALDY